jgi:hypothetical protein
MANFGSIDITTKKIINTLNDISSSSKKTPDRVYEQILNIKNIVLSIYYDRLYFLSIQVKPIIYAIMEEEHSNANIVELVDKYQKILDNSIKGYRVKNLIINAVNEWAYIKSCNSYINKTNTMIKLWDDMVKKWVFNNFIDVLSIQDILEK